MPVFCMHSQHEHDICIPKLVNRVASLHVIRLPSKLRRSYWWLSHEPYLALNLCMPLAALQPECDRHSQAGPVPHQQPGPAVSADSPHPAGVLATMQDCTQALVGRQAEVRPRPDARSPQRAGLLLSMHFWYSKHSFLAAKVLFWSHPNSKSPFQNA